jgi:hypothetical protein
MGKEEIVRKVNFHALRRGVGVANEMNGDVYVGVRYHGTWINHVKEVNVDESLTESCCTKRRGAGD